MSSAVAAVVWSAVACSALRGVPHRARGLGRPASALAAEPIRVVVSGLGVVSAVGEGHKATWESLLAGACGISKVTDSFEDVERFGCHIGAEIRGFDEKPWFNSPKSAKQQDRYTHLAVAAAKLAVDDAGLKISASESGAAAPERVGVVVGSAFGGIGTIEREIARMNDRGPRKVSPFAIPALLGNSAAGVIAIELCCKGPNYGVQSACASGTHAIGEALESIRRGEADVIIAGGSEAAVTPLMYGGFGAMKAMCTSFNENPEGASRPFDAARAGFVMGEGAGVLVLESLEHALARGASTIYAELVGYGATCDAHHITTPAPGGEGLAACIEMALASSGVAPPDVTYVNAHGTSTAYNDKFETMALKKVFGPHAEKLLVSSTKGSTGHTLGAAGGIEAAIAALAVYTDTVPPTINYQTADPECDLNYVPNTPIHVVGGVQVAISENLGFGGHNGVLVFKKFVA